MQLLVSVSPPPLPRSGAPLPLPGWAWASDIVCNSGSQHFGANRLCTAGDTAAPAPGPHDAQKKCMVAGGKVECSSLCTALSPRSPASLEEPVARLNPRFSSDPSHLRPTLRPLLMLCPLPGTSSPSPPSLQVRPVLLCLPSL